MKKPSTFALKFDEQLFLYYNYLQLYVFKYLFKIPFRLLSLLFKVHSNWIYIMSLLSKG